MSRGWLGRLLGAGLALAALMSGSQASAADGPRLGGFVVDEEAVEPEPEDGDFWGELDDECDNGG